jgi:uncharacterized protein YjbJ (UPF0337 family)
MPLGAGVLVLLSRNSVPRRSVMKNSTKDKTEGVGHQVKGAVKENVGKVVDDQNLKDEGAAERAGGKVQKKVGDVEKALEK